MLNDMVTALEAALERLKEREEEAAAAAAAALTRHLETQAALEALQDEIAKTHSAIAVMRGETPVPQVAKTADSHTDVAPASAPDEAPEPAPEPGVYSDGTPHKKARKRSGVYAGIECTGCGEVGSLYEEMKQLGNGRVLRFLTCGSCKSSRPV